MVRLRWPKPRATRHRSDLPADLQCGPHRTLHATPAPTHRELWRHAVNTLLYGTLCSAGGFLAARQLQNDWPGRRLYRRAAEVWKSVQEVGEPVLHRGGLELAYHGLPPFAPLFDAHVQRHGELPGHAVDVVRIDQDRRI